MCRRFGKTTLTSHVRMYLFMDGYGGDLSFGVSLEMKPCMLMKKKVAFYSRGILKKSCLIIGCEASCGTKKSRSQNTPAVHLINLHA